MVGFFLGGGSGHPCTAEMSEVGFSLIVLIRFARGDIRPENRNIDAQ